MRKELKQRVQVLLDAVTMKELDSEATKKGLAKSSYVRVLLKEKFNKENGRK